MLFFVVRGWLRRGVKRGIREIKEVREVKEVREFRIILNCLDLSIP